MNTQTNWWIGGAVAVVLIGFGFWWYGRTPAVAPMVTTDTPAAGATASTTPKAIVEERKNSTVAGVVAELTNGGTFATYLANTGVSASITGKGPYTVFVPSNNAFSLLPPGTITNLSAAAQKRLVQYHIVVGRKLDISIVNTGTIQALSKDALNFKVDEPSGVAQVNNSYIIHEYRASNGVVYVISAVLLPPLAPLAK